MKQVGFVLITLALSLGLWWGGNQGAIANALATLHTYPNSQVPDQVMYRSLQTLRDETGQAWQAVFYKQVNRGQVETLHLRLVGFPGQVVLQHPQALVLRDGQGRRWEAADVFGETRLEASLADHVGEYDMRPLVLEALVNKRPLWLEVAIAPSSQATIPVPPFAVGEWQQLLDR